MFSGVLVLCNSLWKPVGEVRTVSREIICIIKKKNPQTTCPLNLLPHSCSSTSALATAMPPPVSDRSQHKPALTVPLHFAPTRHLQPRALQAQSCFTSLFHVLCSSSCLLLLLQLNHFYVLLRQRKKLIKLNDNLDTYLKLH